jgi:hypothetical protein
MRGFAFACERLISFPRLGFLSDDFAEVGEEATCNGGRKMQVRP